MVATVDGLVLIVVQWEKLRLEAEAATLKECTFAPKPVANNRRHLAGYVPIQDRLGELQRRKRCASALHSTPLESIIASSVIHIMFTSKTGSGVHVTFTNRTGIVLA